MLKTKVVKHLNDNEKRKQALNEKAKVKSNQLEIIKQALSTKVLHSSQSKKIKFDEDGFDQKINGSNVELFGEKKTVLFDDESNSEVLEFDIKEKTQFHGKKGYELLQLQASYGNDERFKVDERFLDKAEEGTNGYGSDQDIEQLGDIKDTLEDLAKSKKSKKRNYEMIRYDASNEEHKKYEISQSNVESEKPETKKRKKEKKIEKKIKQKVEVSNEKFYEVSKDIKDVFNEKKEQCNGGFSLLQMYSNKEGNHCEDSGDDDSEINAINELQLRKDKKKQFAYGSDDEMKEKTVKQEAQLKSVDNRRSELINESHNNPIRPKETKHGNVAVAKGVWKELFFFTDDDPRLQEGLDFINMKNSKEAEEAAENYDSTRRKLREILRLHNKKQLMRKNPFRNKVGGMNKKQQAKTQNKNNKIGNKMFQKNKHFKVNPQK